MNTQRVIRNDDGTNTFEVVTPDGVVVDTWDAPGPTNTWECDCGATVERYRGGREVQCPKCDQWFNASGQRLRNDWMGNMSNWDDDVSDLDGDEMRYADWFRPLDT